jgi:hypothetical protein
MAYTTNDSNLEIARGNIDRLSVVNKFGENTDIADGIIEDVWDGGGTYPFPTTATITHIKQSVDQATMRGKTIEVQGLNATWDLVTQNVVLDGTLTTTLVALGTPLIRVFRMKVMANVVGTQNIVLVNAGATVTYAQITAGANQTLMAIYTVPRGFTAYITNYYYDYVRDAIKDPDSVEFGLWVADRANNYEFQIKHNVGLPKLASGQQHFFKPYFKVTEKSDIKMTALSDGAGANVHAGFDLILEDT